MNRFFFYVFIFGFIFAINDCYAQYQGISTDSLFFLARQNAFDGDRQKAHIICDTILKRNDNYVDARLLKGRMYSWNKKYDSARMQFRRVLEQKPGYAEALDGMIDVEYWAGADSICVKYCNDALKLYPNDSKFIIKKAKALDDQKKYDEAIQLLENYLRKFPQNTDVKKLLESIKAETYHNQLSASYSYKYFDNKNADPWQLAYIQYLRKTKKGSVIGRLNYANRYKIDG